MTNCTAEVIWERGGQNFLDKRYTRKHLWRFDGGLEVAASSSPAVVPVPMSDAAAVDPEEALIASLSSCHMLWFLALAAKNKYRVDRYRDGIEAQMGEIAKGKVALTLITLHPEVHFSGELMPAWDDVLAMHAEAHDLCYIANSLKSEVRIEPRPAS
jgi:organic hydroperoxide reductase OsmC/OhrA